MGLAIKGAIAAWIAMACIQPPLLTVAGQRWTCTKLSPLPPVAAPHWNRLREYTIFQLVPRKAIFCPQRWA